VDDVAAPRADPVLDRHGLHRRRWGGARRRRRILVAALHRGVGEELVEGVVLVVFVVQQ